MILSKVKIFGYNTKDNTKEEIEKEINENLLKIRMLLI